MALNNLQALEVVIGSVRHVTGRVITPVQTLKDGGLVDAPRLGAFTSVVVADPDVGVEKHRHEIKGSALSALGIDTGVQATADLVRANATPITADVRESDAVPADVPAPRRAARRPERKARKKVRAQKGARKKAGVKPAGKRKARPNKARANKPGANKASRAGTASSRRSRKADDK
jgi:hypothetical protein